MPSHVYFSLNGHTPTQTQTQTQTQKQIDKIRSDEAHTPRQREREQDEDEQPREDDEEGYQVIAFPERDLDVHPEETTHQIERDENRREHRDLAEDLIRSRALGDIINGQLGEVIAMRATQHLLKVPQVGHHGDDVVLNVAEVEPDVHAWRDVVVLVAAFGEAAEDVGFAAEELHERHDGLADVADGAQEVVHVVAAGDEDLVFDGVGFGFDLVDEGGEGVDDVIAVGVSYYSKMSG
jgi:hypothetical protein